MIPRVYHVTAVTVYKLDGIEVRTREYYNDSRLRDAGNDGHGG